MSDDEVFLRAMIATPDDATLRLVYADWLEERSDPRAELLRSNWDLSRLSYVDWVANRGGLSYYLQKFPELRSQLPEHEGNRWWRNKLAALDSAVSREWVLLIDTLGRPFRPFFFWNNTGPRSYQEGQLPFQEPIGTRGAVVTFASAFRGEKALQPGLAEDLVLLSRLGQSDFECEYGAASCPVHPFLCELEARSRPLTGAEVLRALKVKDFRTQHIEILDASAIPYPGYHPGTDNDEIHNDVDHQCLFPRPEDVPEVDDEANGPRARQAIHDALCGGVVDRQLWYVLLHSRAGLPPELQGLGRGSWVVLFAVGQSLQGSRLIGVVSHQICHNLCD